MKYPPERADALAADYVLGTMPRRARERMARLARSNTGLADAIQAWEVRLAPLAERISPVTPPDRVWRAIRARIERGRVTQPPVQSIWSNLSLWRGLTLAGFATAVALSVVLLTPRPELPAGTLVVVLAGQDAKTALLASADRAGKILTVKVVGAVPGGADQTLELWALPAGGNPRSLGLIPALGVARIALAAPAGVALENIPALAVSLEPPGGSPTGQPTGPVLYSGPVQRLY